MDDIKIVEAVERYLSGEMPADDLIAGVALDALRALVPVGDASIGIEHEDGVVPHTFQ